MCNDRCHHPYQYSVSVARSLSAETVKAVVHAFISSSLDYYNSLGVNDGLLWRVQSVQNAATRLVTGTWRCEHITPALQQLHWLPVWQYIQYKLASLAFRAGLLCRRLSACCRFRTEIPAVRRAMCLLCATSDHYLRRSILRGCQSSRME